MIKKLNWRWLMMLAAVMMMGVTMTACGDDDDDDDDDDDAGTPGQYVGVWADAEEIAEGYNEVFAVNIKANGTGEDGEWNLREGYFEGDGDSFDWSVEGDMLTITADGHSATVRFSISEDGNTGTMYATDGPEHYVKVQ